MKHELKTWPEFFEKVLSGEKRFEVRHNDRNFQVGDELILHEWMPGALVNGKSVGGEYTGRKAYFHVTYVMSGYNWGIRKDFVIMSIIPKDTVS